MAAAITVRDYWDDGKRVHIMGTITLSGSYASGGDTLTLTGLFPGQRTAAEIVNVQGKAGYFYEPDRANSKLKVRYCAGASTAAAEIGAGAYAGALTGDVIDFTAICKKFV